MVQLNELPEVDVLNRQRKELNWLMFLQWLHKFFELVVRKYFYVLHVIET